MTEDHAKQFFGKMPPDLSVIARVRGSDWIYTYLKSFYLDESRPLGWNNTCSRTPRCRTRCGRCRACSMREYGKADAGGDRAGREAACWRSRARRAPEQFDQTVRDITAFLEYAGEPAALKRQSMGVWVILFLAFFTFLAWLLKKEYWRDVH